jgi:hypothetical protein
MSNQSIDFSKIVRKSKLEILQETHDVYSDATMRGFDPDGNGCHYLTSDGKMCSVGRCLLNPQDCEGGIVNLLKRNADGSKHWLTDEEAQLEFKPEYRSHPIRFWRQIQLWHDNSSHFTDTGISEKGEAVYKGLVADWSEYHE